MVIQSSHLHFLPRSVQLNKPLPPPMDMDKKKKKKKHSKSIDQLPSEELNPSHAEEFDLKVERKRKRKNASLVTEEDTEKTDPSPPTTQVDGDSNGLKKDTKNKKKKDKHSPEAVELEQLIARFLSSRGLSNTLSVFLSETQHEFAEKAQNLDLEEIYRHYLTEGGARFKKEKGEEVKLRERAGDAALKHFGKLNEGVKLEEEDIKKKSGKEKSEEDDAEVVPPTTCGATAGALGGGLYRSDKRHDSVKESMDDLKGHAQSKKTAKGKKNSGVLIDIYKGKNEPQKPTNESGEVSELAEPEAQKMPWKEKKKMAGERLLSDNKEQTDSKKSKKEKKAHAEKLCSTDSHAIIAEAVNGGMLYTLEDSRNEVDIKKSSTDKMTPRDNEDLASNKKRKKEKKAFEQKLHSTGSHPIDGEAAKESREYLSEDPRHSLDAKVSKKKKWSDGMIPRDTEEQIGRKKSKKEKKALEKLLPINSHASYPIIGEAAKESSRYLSGGPGNSLDIKVSKKEKRSDGMIPRDIEEQISGKKSKKEKKALLEELLLTGSHAINGETAKETMEVLSEDPGNSPEIKMSRKKKKKRSDEMIARDNEDPTSGNKSKKGKKALQEKLQPTGSHTINGEIVKGSTKDLVEDANNSQDIAQDRKTLEPKEFVKGAEVQSMEDSAVMDGYWDRGTAGKLHSGKEEVKSDMSVKPRLKSKKNERQMSDIPTAAKAFQRVKAEEVKFVDPRLQDNSYWAKDGAENGYGAKAQEVLGQVRGKNFRHEKTKKKRGSYTGGMIDLQSHSIKFNYSDEEEHVEET